MLLVWLLIVAGLAYYFGTIRVPAGPLPSPIWVYRGYTLCLTVVSSLLLIVITMAMTPMDWPPYIACVLAATVAIWHSRKLQKEKRRARFGFEQMWLGVFMLAAGIALATTVGIISTVAIEASRFFSIIPASEFFFGTLWSPQIAIREDQAGATGAFGFIPLLTGTLLITFVAMSVALPMGLTIAVYLSDFATAQMRSRIKPLLEVLAGIPTVVYGFFAVIALSPLLKDLGASLGVEVAGESALAAGIVMGMMLIPFIASLSEDALFAVPRSLRDGAFALGSTRLEVVTKVAIPSALPGIVAGILLAVSRAIGETMIVVMAAGVAAHLTLNPVEAVTTVTVQIVTLLTGDQEFDDPKTLAAFALGMSLFVLTLLLNVIALHIVKKYSQRYE